MANAKKLPSGNWRVQVYTGLDKNQKRTYKSFTASSKKEAEFLAADYQFHRKQRKAAGPTLKELIDEHIESKRNIFSPSTIRGYAYIRDRRLGELADRSASQITEQDIQLLANHLAVNLAPKTVRNTISLVLTVMAPYGVFKPALPQKKKYIPYIPTDGEVAQLIDQIYNTEMEIPILLYACAGLRRSEICALEWQDFLFSRNQVLIDKAMVMNEQGQWVIKTTKTTSSTRIVDIPPFVSNRIQEISQIKPRPVEITPNAVTGRFQRLVKHRFTLHNLRHYFASVMLSLNIPDKYAMERMGHSTPNMLKTVYQHTMQHKENEVTNSINNYFVETIQHKLQHEI